VRILAHCRSTEASARTAIEPAVLDAEQATDAAEVAELKVQAAHNMSEADKAKAVLSQTKCTLRNKKLAVEMESKIELQRHKLAASGLQFCHKSKWAASLPGNYFLHPVQQGGLLLPRGWTVFHELASGSAEARKAFWETESCAFPDGCFVPTRLHKSVTEKDLKMAGLLDFDGLPLESAGVCGRSSNVTGELPFADLTALDITILRKDVEGMKYLLRKLKPGMELVFSANITSE
jgi:hypothetical protein